MSRTGIFHTSSGVVDNVALNLEGHRNERVKQRDNIAGASVCEINDCVYVQCTGEPVATT